MDPELRLRFLGPPQIMLDQRVVRFKRQKSLALLAYLVVMPGEHYRDRLATLIAGETTDQRARQQLRNALGELRGVLGDHLIITRQTIAFDRTRAYWLDVDAFRQGLHLAGDDIAQIEEAVSWYSRGLLAGLSLPNADQFEGWLATQSHELHHLLVQSLRRLLDHYTRQNQTEQGITTAERLIALEPWREEAYMQLMLLLARDGQRSAALAQFAICQRILADDLHIGPSAEMVALYQRIRHEAIEPPADLPPVQMLYVRREHDLKLIAEWLMRVVAVRQLGQRSRRGVQKTIAYLKGAIDNVPSQVYLVSWSGKLLLLVPFEPHDLDA